MTNAEIFKAYAEGKTNGKTSQGSLFITGDTIYSYGTHYPMARRNLETKTAIVNDRKYSATTSKQTSGLISALIAPDTKSSARRFILVLVFNPQQYEIYKIPQRNANCQPERNDRA